ncbi:MAG: hypothetical protein AB7O47_13190 [Flavobacteriales bacterium]
MIDFVRIEVENPDIDFILKHPYLKFKQEFYIKTGEIIGNKRIAEHRGLTFKIYDSGRLFIHGSLHKYKNVDNNNHNSFYLKELYLIIGHLEKTYKINPYNAAIHSIEFGVNIIPPIPTQVVLKGLFAFKWIEFKNVSPWNGNIKRVNLSQYDVKVYDKAQQCELKNELMRFEIKITKMEKLDKFKCIYLADLFNPYFISRMKRILLNSWDGIILFDFTIFDKNLSNQELSLLKDWSNPLYWIDLKNDTPYSNRNKPSRECTKFKQLFKKHNADIQLKLQHIISNEWDKLSEYGDSKTQNDHTSKGLISTKQ